MAESLDLKTVLKHLANGSLSDYLCLVCLLPLTEDNYENIFTSICKKDDEFCVADVLREVCQIKIPETEHYSICCNCFQSAVTAYRFHLKVKHSFEILNFYTDQLLSNVENLEVSEEDTKPLFFIPLPDYQIPSFDYALDGIGTRKMEDVDNFDDINDAEVILVVEDDKSVLYKVQNELKLEVESEDENVLMIVNEKTRKKRDPLISISCLHCPVKYRFISKLKEHMKKIHNAAMYYCKICKLITDKKDDYDEHLTMHIGKYQCKECNNVYIKMASLMEHLKSHEKSKCEAQNMVETGNICEICGKILEDEIALEAHRSERHVKRYTCFYCGRMYRGQASFEAHILKHENNLKKLNNQPPKKQETESKSDAGEKEKDKSSKRAICGTCGKSFVDERSLLWHQRLHNNDRPFICNICSRGFISVNRLNQHAVCAHSRPARRCPLCPALFHLRSMVNTHLKKVHLNRQNKRRTRAVKHKNVFWKTETVPIQELSVSIQNEVLEMQSCQEDLKNAKKRDTKRTYRQPVDMSLPQPKAHSSKDGVLWMENSDILMQQEYEFRSNDFITLPMSM